MNENDNNNAYTEFLKEVNQEVGELMGVDIPAPVPASDTRRGKRNATREGFQISGKATAWIIVICVIVLLLGGGVASVSFLRTHGRNSLKEHITVEGQEFTPVEDAIVADGGDTVTWQGKTYRKNDSVINVLCVGVDKTANELENEEDTVYGSAGQADTIFLAVMDTDTGEVTLLNISRDTMTDVDIYNADGEYTDTRKEQVCTAYAYGDGGDSSCMNMVKAVSGLMYGIPIDAYAAVDLPAVSILNDAIGGVEVTVLEDLSDRDSSLTEGSVVLLQGHQAEIYVRSRDQSDASANSRRMARQRQYVTAFLQKAYTQIRNDWSTALKLYQAAEAYTCTSMRLSQMLYLASVAVESDFSQNDIITIPGEAVMGEQYAEFYVDEEALFQIIMDTYYEEVS